MNHLVTAAAVALGVALTAPAMAQPMHHDQEAAPMEHRPMGMQPMRHDQEVAPMERRPMAVQPMRHHQWRHRDNRVCRIRHHHRVCFMRRG
jgi:uncharacterized protein involved in copper resistance